jgi:hypothetical protein
MLVYLKICYNDTNYLIEGFIMKKLFISLTVLIILLIGTVFAALFTSTGNGFIASYIENKVNDESNDVQLKVNDFTLTLDTINFNATINDNSTIKVAGNLEIFKKKVDLTYDIKINELSKLQNLTKQKLNGPFSTSGTFKGDANFSVIEGISNIAKSDTKYNLKLVDFEAKNIKFDMKNARVEDLLYLLNNKNFAKGKLNISGDIKNANIKNLDGKIIAKLSKGKINNEVVNKEFKQNIQTRVYFKSDIIANLSPNTIKVKSDLITSLADVFANNTVVNLENGNIQSDYKVDVKNLSKLQGIIGTKLFGNFITTGSIRKNSTVLKVDGISDIFGSDTSYSFKMEEDQAQLITFNIKDGKIDKLLHLLNEPVYAIGLLNIKGDIKNSQSDGMNGNIDTTISAGKLINPVVNTVFKQKLKKTVTYSGNINTKLVAKEAISTVNLKTSLASMAIKKAVFNFENASLNSDYLLQVPKLEDLYDLTGTKMRGSFNLAGNVKNKNKSLLLTGNSKLLDGVLDFTLKNDDLNATFNGMQIKKLTHMLYYPEFFDSKSSLSLDYNLLLKKGKLKGNLLDGHFLPNKFSSLLNQFAKFDITREIYDTVDINSNINKLVLTSTVAMKSKNTNIDVTKSVLDLGKSTIDAAIKAKIKKTEFGFKVKGKTSRPKISIDSKGLIKTQINKQLEKNKDKIKEKLNKVLKGKLGNEGAEKILNNLKSLF